MQRKEKLVRYCRFGVLFGVLLYNKKNASLKGNDHMTKYFTFFLASSKYGAENEKKKKKTPLQ